MPFSITGAKKYFSNTDKTIIYKILNKWARTSPKQQQIVKNLRNEHFINTSVITNLFNLIITNKNKPLKELRLRIFQYYQNYILSGGKPILNKNLIAGFVLTEWSIRENLKNDFFDYFSNDLLEVESFISNIKLNNTDPYLGWIPIKKYKDVLWVTFSENSSEPFDFLLNNNRLEVYTALALSKKYKNNPIFLFKFNVSTDLAEKFQRATTFDAQNYQYFRPPNTKMKMYGYTNPHNRGKIKIKLSSYNINKRPEIVIDTREITYSIVTTHCHI